jgi:hypothetical protein
MCRPRSSNWGPAGGQLAEGEGFGGPACGDEAEAATADGGGYLVHASSWTKMGVAPPTSLFVTPPLPPLGHATSLSMSLIV